MKKKKIGVFLFDAFSDWEIAYLSPEIRKSNHFELIYFSDNGNAVHSMGGLHVTPEASIKDVTLEICDMLILPGGTAWEENSNDQIEPLIKAQLSSGRALAAICAATTYLGRLGILDQVKHTSNDRDYLRQYAPQYQGEAHYLDILAVADKNIVTANGIAPIEFAREVFTVLELYDLNQIEKWFQLFKHGIWNE